MTTFGSLPGACHGPWGRWAARERLLDAPVVELPGSHSPFRSRPADLVEALVELRGRL
jgi:hypothetical protein